jgi:hypothetical protein
MRCWPTIILFVGSACSGASSKLDGGADASPEADALGALDSSEALDQGPGPDGGLVPDSGPPVTVTTIQQIVAHPGTGQHVNVPNAVVIAVAPRIRAEQIFYIQDQGPAGPGIAVRKARTDRFTTPSVGNIVTVQGRVGEQTGVLVIEASARDGTLLEVTVTSSTGTVMGGAYPPAGTPISTATTAGYAHTATEAHAAEIGNVIQFPGPLRVTRLDAFSEVLPMDAGVRYVGFEVSGGLWVDDTYIPGCTPSATDGGLPSFPRGIRGMWDHFAIARTSSRASVLYPISCGDLNPN